MVPNITVTDLGEYIRHQSCERRFKLAYNNREEAKKLPFATRLFNTIDPVLQDSGRKKEEEWEESLKELGYEKIDSKSGEELDLRSFFGALFLTNLEHGRGYFARELSIEGTIEGFAIRGRIDFLIIIKHENSISLRIVECKASRRDRTYHRIQVCVYKMLIEKYLKLNPVFIDGVQLLPSDIEAVVARIDESTNRKQEILSLDPLVLDRETADIKYLLANEGPLKRILNLPLDDLDYYLNNKCDDCVFNVNCFPESGRKKSLQLLSINPSAVRILKANGIKNLDDLANLNIDNDIAKIIRSNPSFSYALDLLVKKAKARRKTLIGGGEYVDEYKVTQFSYSFNSQLPAYQINNNLLIRVYMAVDYDYVENRIVSLSAHITKSLNKIETFYKDPVVYEIDSKENLHDVCGEIVVEKVDAIWTGNFEVDNGTERQLISSFFRKVIDSIAQVAATEEAPIHFYVWTRNEIKSLVEACSRVDTTLISSFNQLLGCRESLEQLIFSCVQDEVDKRFALGWTGRGLAVVSSLSWFGKSFHWFRKVSGKEIYLDRIFTQDIFDFKTDLEIGSNGEWAKTGDSDKMKHKFEIRSRFNDGLTVPYWHAYWDQLPDPDSSDNLDPQVKSSIRRYNQAKLPGYINAFLENRLYALRWLEERIENKNTELSKPILRISELAQFNLNVNTTSRSALDFLRLDFQVGLNDWIASGMHPPINRIIDKGMIPIKDLRATNKKISAIINLSDDEIRILESNTSHNIDSFVRISPCFDDLHKGQTVRQLLNIGVTGRIESVDWERKRIVVDSIPYFGNADYIIKSSGSASYDFATIDESISDFVSSRVDKKLKEMVSQPNHVERWFNPINPAIPDVDFDEDNLKLIKLFLDRFEFDNGHKLLEDQSQAILDSLSARIHLLLGPPGTGKTMTTATATLIRAFLLREKNAVIVITANTHMAVDNLLSRIRTILLRFSLFIENEGYQMPNVNFGKIDAEQDVSGIEIVKSNASFNKIKQLSTESILILGGTTSGLLKLAEKYSTNKVFSTEFLVVDEASMLVFPHFLAVSSLVTNEGSIMLAGDHKQLSPIISHDWEREDRPPVVLYQPYLSAYEAIRNIALNGKLSHHAIKMSSLKYTFRLPFDVRNLISRLYVEENIELLGESNAASQNVEESEFNIFDWRGLWSLESGLFLVLHDERESRKSNFFEAQIIKKLMEEADSRIESNSVAIITPHRAQRTLLTKELSNFREKVGVIDTVERLQGGEKPNIIISATASDPSSIGENAEFILNLNRANVAFSRAQKRLIVVCSKELINFIPADIEHYNSSLLWKTVRNICKNKMGDIEVEGRFVSVYTVERNKK